MKINLMLEDNEFVPHKEALALKELGFDEPCFGFYSPKGILHWVLTKTPKDVCKCLAPTFLQAFRWFREKHNLESIIEPRWKYPGAEKKYCTEVFDEYDESDVRSNDDIYHTDFNTYEEAELACLRQLIKIVNQNKDE